MGYVDRRASGWWLVVELAERQHGVVSRQQLRALGFGDRAITGRIRHGTLVPLYRGAFAVGHAAIGRRGWMMAAVLACGEGTVVSHGSAAELLGLWDRQPALIAVIAPGASGRGIRGIRRHLVLPPTPDEVERRHGIPCTNASRTIVDQAGSVGRRTLQAVIEQAAILGVLDPEEIDRILAQGRRRGAPQLRTAMTGWRRIGDIPKLRSRLEARLLALVVESGLPKPRCNVRIRLEGRWLEVDFLWAEQRLVVETDGARTHDNDGAFRRDRWRGQLLVAGGYRTISVTWSQLDDEPEAVIARIGRALRGDGR